MALLCGDPGLLPTLVEAILRVLYSGIWHYDILGENTSFGFGVQGQTKQTTDISEEHTGSIFSVDDYSACNLLDLIFFTKDGGSMLLQNISKLLPECIVSHPREWYTSSPL